MAGVSPLILYIDCSIKTSSVAIARGTEVLAVCKAVKEYAAAEVVHPHIDSILSDADIGFNDLEAVCISGGPGSYTGLRIATSAAKGLCFALNIPLLQVSTLEMMVWGAITRYGWKDFECYIPMIDARRMEVFSAQYTYRNEKVLACSPPRAVILTEDDFLSNLPVPKILLFGDGAAKCRTLIHGLSFTISEDYDPLSTDMILPCLTKWQDREFEDIAYFEPHYLKEYQFK